MIRVSIRPLARALAAALLAGVCLPLVAGAAQATDPLRGAIVANSRLALTPHDVRRVKLDPARSYVVGAAWTVAPDHDDDHDDAPGVHDHADDDVRVYARYLHLGAWTDWQILAADGQLGDSEETAATGGTEPAVVSNSTSIEIRVESEVPPDDLRLVLFTPDDGDTQQLPLARKRGGVAAVHALAVEVRESGRGNLASALALPASNLPPDPQEQVRRSALVDIKQPEIHLRSEWLARPTTYWYDKATVQGAAVHHTAGTNDYSRGETADLLRGIQDYHMDERGFWDIGYNFLIDRWGRIWEGRGGGITNTWHGAHSHSFNEYVTGVSMMGTFTDDTPPGAAVNGLVSLLAWKLSLHGVSADGQVMHPSGTQPAIIGHRDVPEAVTECPGQALYDMLPEIRRRVARAQQLPTVRLETDVTGDGSPDSLTVTATHVEVRSTGLAADSMRAPYASGRTLAPVPAGYEAVAYGPLGATAETLLLRHQITGDAYAASLEADGGLGPLTHVAAVPPGTLVALPGDVTGDGVADLVLADREAGSIAIRAGASDGSMGERIPSGELLGPITAIAAAGDVTADGVPDVAVALANGAVVILAGAGDGGLTPGDPIELTWGGADGIVAAGDLTGDGIADLVVTSSWNKGGHTLVGGADGLTGEAIDWRPNAYTWAAPLGAGVAVGGSVPTVVAIGAGGNLIAALPTAQAGELAPSTSVIERAGVTQAAIVGDVDGNGFADVVTMNAGGGLLLHPSLGDGFAEPVLLLDPSDADEREANAIADGVPLYVPADNPGWSEFESIAGAGDFDFDGVPDLLAVDLKGNVWIYRWSSSDPGVLQDRIRVAKGLSGYRVFGAGSWRRGHIADLIAVREDGTVVLVTGEGMTGTKRRTVIATVDADVAESVTSLGVLAGDTYGAVGWLEDGQWVTRSAAAQ